ncbi:MAG: MBL fold metallo-hydrolase, partial [Promethearchaeota archaeon]
MKVQGFDNIFFYKHRFGANCNVYAFKNPDGSLDLVDTGIYYLRPIFATVLKGMKGDGLDFRNVKNIYHTHGHFDHCQADRWILNHSKHEDARVFCPEVDAWRLQKKNGAKQLDYYKNHARKHIPGDFDEIFKESGFGSVQLFFKHAMSKVMHVPWIKDERVTPYSNGDMLSIGGHDARVITTGGHTDGHSFFHLKDLDLLVVGDHDAVNELT